MADKKEKKSGKWEAVVIMSILIMVIILSVLLGGALLLIKDKKDGDNQNDNQIANEENTNIENNTQSDNENNSIVNNEDNEQNNQNQQNTQNEQNNQDDSNTNNNGEQSTANGIIIYAGKEVDENVSYTFGYSYETLTNEEHIKNGKEQLNKVLSRFPKGFWDELLQDKNDSRKSLIISLTGKLKDDANGGEPTGFATYNGDAYYVFMNSAYAGPNGANIEGSLFHELMHVIDFYLQAKGEQYPDWEKYLPSGFTYTGTGANHSESEFAMCSTHATNNDDVWFEAIYSVETAMEDRANIMKELYDNGLSYYKKYPHYYPRMKYLKDILASHFESIRNCGYDWLG